MTRETKSLTDAAVVQGEAGPGAWFRLAGSIEARLFIEPATPSARPWQVWAGRALKAAQRPKLPKRT